MASLMELDYASREGKNCWMVYFSVDDISSTLRVVKKYGGLVIIDVSDTGYGFALVQDTQGAFFCIQGKEKSAN